MITRGNENSRVNVAERGPASRTETPTVIVSAEKKAEIGNVIGGNKPAGSAAQARRETVVRDNIAAPQTPAVVEKLTPGTSGATIEKDKTGRIGEVVGRQPNRETAPVGQDKNKEQLISRIETNRRADTERVVANKTPVTELPEMRNREGNAAGRESRQAIGEQIGEKTPVTQLPELKEREGNAARRENRQVGEKIGEKTPVTQLPELKEREGNAARRENRQVGEKIGEKTPVTQLPELKEREGKAARRDSRQVGEKIGEPAPVTQSPELKEREGNVSRREARSRDTERAIEGKNPVTEVPATVEREGTKGAELVREGRRTERREPERVAPDEERELSKDIVAKHPQMRHGREDENIMYHDREHYDGDHHDGDHHHDRFIFFGYNNSWCYWPIWPSYYYWVNYNCGGYSYFSYVHPYYHRRYVFVSLGGWWPYNYSYMRYYWYGYHPYNWYGYDPVAYQIPYDNTDYYTYNYYTYNYYNTDASSQTGTVTELPAVNEYTFADVRERMAQQAAKEPAPETLADKLFDEGVNAFDLNVFSLAADKFAEAMKLAPDDMILPFAYSQSLFAMGNYTEAAEVLRNALKNVKPEQEGVFYPRGLYHEDKILLDQIEGLAEKAKLYSFDADLQLLLGYQLLGIGETDEALEHLILASRDMTNAPSAQILLDVQRKVKEGQNKQISNNIQTGKTQAGIAYMPASGLAGGTEQWQSNIGTNWRYAAWLFAAWQPQMLLAVGKHSRYIL